MSDFPLQCPKTEPDKDDNDKILKELAEHMTKLPEEEQERIMEELKRRLEKGCQTYGHGVRIGDPYDWFKMTEEELLDALIYLTAALMRERAEKLQEDWAGLSVEMENQDLTIERFLRLFTLPEHHYVRIIMETLAAAPLDLRLRGLEFVPPGDVYYSELDKNVIQTGNCPEVVLRLAVLGKKGGVNVHGQGGSG